MCAGAAFWTRVCKIVFSAPDEKRGFFNKGKHILHPKTEIQGGVMSDECGRLIVKFFEQKR